MFIKAILEFLVVKDVYEGTKKLFSGPSPEQRAYLQLCLKREAAFRQSSNLLQYLNELLRHSEDLIATGVDEKHAGWEERKRVMLFNSLEIVLRKIKDRKGRYFGQTNTYFSVTIKNNAERIFVYSLLNPKIKFKSDEVDAWRKTTDLFAEFIKTIPALLEKPGTGTSGGRETIKGIACGKCGAENNEGAKFCTACGFKLG